MKATTALDKMSARWFDAHIIRKMTPKIELELAEAISELRRAQNAFDKATKRLERKT